MNIHGKAEASQQDLVGISGMVHEHLPADASNVRKSGVLVIGVHDGLGSAAVAAMLSSLRVSCHGSVDADKVSRKLVRLRLPGLMDLGTE